MKKKIITIAGRPGSGKSTAAKEVARILGYKHFSSGDLFRSLVQEHGIEHLTKAINMPDINDKLDDLVDSRLRDIGENEDNIVIDSHTAWHWIPHSFKVFLDLDFLTSAERILKDQSEHRKAVEMLHSNPSEYAKLLEERMLAEINRYEDYYHINPYDLSNYDLVINTAENNKLQVVETVVKEFKNWTKV